jgi:signal transduction histidine kinase
MSDDPDARSSASPDTGTTREVIGERRLKCLHDLAAATGDARSVADVCRIAAKVIGANAADVPFSLIYLRDAAGNTARLLACSGCAAGESFCPELVTVTDTGPGWPLQPTLPDRGGVLRGLAPALGLPAAPWCEATTSAAILPLARRGHDQVRGYLIAGASPRLEFDAPYAHFLDLLAGSVASALANAEARSAAALEKQPLDDFLAVLSHELRNPLAPIMTALELMRLRGDGSFERERAIIERQAMQLVSLVDDLMDVTRITGGQITLKQERVDMTEVIARAIERVSPLLEQRRHTLTTAVPQGLVVPGDAARLTQVVSNLLSNAARNTEPEGRISIEAQHAGAAIVLTVRDNGTGISADLLPRVFDMFTQQRDDSDRSQGGLGLGLSIVRSIVALHGGEVSAHSDGPGRGSEFAVRLPANACV